MAQVLELQNGDYVIAYNVAQDSTIFYEVLDNNLNNITGRSLGDNNTAINRSATGSVSQPFALTALDTGGFEITWQSTSGQSLTATDFDSSGAFLGTHSVASMPAPAPEAFTSLDQAGVTRVYTNDGGTVTMSVNVQTFTVEKFGGAGVGQRSAYTAPTGAGQSNINPVVTGLADGGYAAAFEVHSANENRLVVDLFDHNGISLGVSLTVADYTGSNPISFGRYAISGLPDGGFDIAWTQVDPSASGSTVYSQEFLADHTAASGAVLLGTNPQDIAFEFINALPDGRFTVAWSNGGGGDVTGSFVEAGALPGSGPSGSGGGTGEVLQATGSAYSLNNSTQWTGAAVLSDHTLAVVSSQAGDYGSHTGLEITYDAAGQETQSASLLGYAGAGQTLTPQVTALDGGFYQVNYAGSSDYEVYNAAEQRVFVHNQYASQTAAFTALTDGGYLVTDSASNVFGLFGADNQNQGWLSVPADAAGAPAARALSGGGFVFTYANSGHFDVFDASGALTGAGDLGAATSSFAEGFAALSGGGFIETFLSPDGGQNGLATALDLQAFDGTGHAATAVLNLGQDLDPWGTQFAVQAHGDGSAAILWSQGGAVFGAEYAGGQVGSAVQIDAGDLSDLHAIQLSTGGVGLVLLQGGEAVAEIFDPVTGSVHKTDLGAASGDLSTLHALATANGGMAVSWHSGSAVDGAVMGADGAVGSTMTLAGDLIGVDGAGNAVTLHTALSTPVLQAYTVSDTGFWVH
jgi:hypothetical protein